LYELKIIIVFLAVDNLINNNNNHLVNTLLFFSIV
jgi:hypothetical protein